MLVFSSRSAALAERIGPRLQLTVGPLLAAAGLLLLTRVGRDATWVRHVLPGADRVRARTGHLRRAVDRHRDGIGRPRPGQYRIGVNNAIARTASLGALAVIPAACGLTTATGPEEITDAVGPGS